MQLISYIYKGVAISMTSMTYDLLSDHQFGFTPGRSCTTQLLYVLDYFTKHLDRGELIDVIYLDFQKAFDSVPHQRLIKKLTSFGKILQWINDSFGTGHNKFF